MELTRDEQSVLMTLAHFDVLDYPLTLLELVKFNTLGLPAADMLRLVSAGGLGDRLSARQGLYCLRGREALIALRLTRYRSSLLKLRHARRFAALLSAWPWIRAVALYSSLALKNSRADSDIDLFFITAAGRVWSARFWLNTLLKLFRLRPTPSRSQDRLCASYLADSDNLNLSFANSGEPDYFYAYGCASFIFLASHNDLAESFWQKNSWIKAILPAWQPAVAIRYSQPPKAVLMLQAIKEKILALIPEKSYQSLQLKILPQRYFDANDGKRVHLGQCQIKLHHNDKRGKYNELFAANFRRALNYDQPS